MKRKSMSRRSSKRLFRRTASRHAAINYKPTPMRGGIRL